MIIEQLTTTRISWLADEYTQRGYGKAPGYFDRCFAAQEAGELLLWLARRDDELLGYVKLVFYPDYPPFRDAGIPEVQDLNVVPAARRQGVASQLLDQVETIAGTIAPIIGIGVGLHPGYGAAQRLYVLRGYVPDARPITYNNAFVTERQVVTLDDDLVLHLTKRLR